MSSKKEVAKQIADKKKLDDAKEEASDRLAEDENLKFRLMMTDGDRHFLSGMRIELD